MRKRYNTPHRSHVIKTRLSDEEYADFTKRLAPYGISQSEFLRQAIRRAAIRPVIHVSAVNDELLSAVGKLAAEYGKIGGNLNQIARCLNEYGAPYPQLAKELRGTAAELAALKYEVLQKVGGVVGNTQTYEQSGFSSLEELEAALTEACAGLQDTTAKLKALERTLSGKKELRRQILAFAKTKPVREGLKAQKSDKARQAYREQHESDFIIADAAARYFKEQGYTKKLPARKDLQAEIEQLTTEKNALYCQYREKKERVRQLQTVKGNIDQLLRRSEPQRGKRQDLDR